MASMETPMFAHKVLNSNRENDDRSNYHDSSFISELHLIPEGCSGGSVL